jgi:hypothetical protein
LEICNFEFGLKIVKTTYQNFEHYIEFVTRAKEKWLFNKRKENWIKSSFTIVHYCGVLSTVVGYCKTTYSIATFNRAVLLA